MLQAILADKESDLLEPARYVVLNPVRAGMVGEADESPWSRECAMVGEVPELQWLAADTTMARTAPCIPVSHGKMLNRVAASGIK